MKQGNGDPVAGPVRREGDAESAQAGERIRPARQLLRELRCERRRAQLVHGRDRARLHAELWPNSYARRRKTYDYEGQEPANAPPAGYIWTAASQAGVTMRNYGYFVDNRAKRRGRTALRSRACAIRSWRRLPIRITAAFDLDYPDVERAKVFISELQDFEKIGNMPQFLIMRHGQRSYLRHHCRVSSRRSRSPPITI